jgi:hypothetical protein
VLHGFGTALVSEAARWLTRTGLFARALFVSFEAGGGPDWAVTQMGRLLLGDDFSSLPEGERLPKLRGALAEAPTLIVWDNFESVLPGWHAALPDDDLQELLELGIALVEDSPLPRMGEGHSLLRPLHQTAPFTQGSGDAMCSWWPRRRGGMRRRMRV